MADPESAVDFRNACKTYGRGSAAKVVLEHFNMKVPRGSIYGLLGASGCGKTTILACIAGRLKLDSGELQVLGGAPGTKGSGIPGPRIGYMPQEVSLLGEMTARNVFYYFGWMFAMTGSEIEERYEFLSKLLDLPAGDLPVCQLSGGQQRRVSLAASLVQTPELLLLDEPTVGLDPLLRQSIWDYLTEISRDRYMTIIITTHYIEEATQAHKIGFLREGKLLADASPAEVIARYHCASLEQVYLLLSQRQEDERSEPPAVEVVPQIEAAAHSGAIEHDSKVEPAASPRCVDNASHARLPAKTKRPTASARHRVRALLYKDFTAMFKNKAGIVFMFLLPLIQIPIFFIAIGNDPFDLPLAIVNDEHPNCLDVIDNVRNTSGVSVNWDGPIKTCHYQNLSCLFIDKLVNSVTVKIIYYSDQEAALEASRRRGNQAVLSIPRNFSTMFQKRLQESADAWSTPGSADEAIEGSEIKAWVDMSNYLIGNKLRKYLYDKFGELTDAISDGCEVSRKGARVPMQFLKPVYGTEDQSFRTHMEPGLLLMSAFFLSTVLTATTLTSERINGLWDRNLIAGATHAEIILSHVLCNLVGVMITAGEILLIALYAFSMTCHGSVGAVVVIITLQAFAGTTFGIFISAISSAFMDAVYITVGTVMPCLLISGIVWPFESMPLALQFFSYISPATLPSMALGNILIRGYAVTNVAVFPGFLATIAWIAVPYTLAVFILRRK